jgi:hypothetical protein
MRYTAILITCLCLVVCALSTNAKSIADSIAYQGSLTDVSNNPVSDGPRDLTISVWTDSVGGTMLYSEIRTVTTSKGLFSTCIGCGASAFPDLFDGQTLFLQLQLAGQAPMTPRTRLRGTPYAMSASSLSASATNGSSVASALIKAKQTANFVPEVFDEMSFDLENDGNPETSDRRTVSANDFHHNSMARSGSTTATIRQMVVPDSANEVLSLDQNGDGIPEVTFGKSITPLRSQALATRALEDTDLRVRMAADSGQGGFDVSMDTNGDSHPEAVAVSAVARIGGAAAASYAATGRLSVDNNSDGTPDNEIESIVTPTTSSVAINTKGTGADKGRTAVITTTGVDSAGLVSTYDANGDGIDETSFTVTVDSNGTALKTKSKSVMNILSNLSNETAPSERKAGLTSTVDSDEDGVPDVDASMTVTPTTASVAINTKGTGADKNRVVLTTTPDGASLETSAAGKNIGIYVSATGGQSALVMTDSSGGLLDTTVYIDGKNAKVGIGVSQPTARLQVVGGAYCDGTNWVNASDRNVKENFESVNGEELLDKIAELPITKWNYKGDTKTEHIGPTAQDFQETFGVGSDGKSISTIDPSGIALAGIKELSKQNRELQQQNRDLQKQNAELKKQMDDLARKVAQLASGR